MSPPAPCPAVASASLASRGALRALAGLAEALGAPGAVPAALAEAREALAAAEAAREELEAALPGAVPGPGPGAPGAEGLYRALAAAAEGCAAELERELCRNRRRRRALRLGRNVAAGLMLLCALLLSLDAVREALGMTQESHLVPGLAAVAILCQVALWGSATSKHHLTAAAGHQRQQAGRYRGLARATEAATAEATAATAEAAAAATAANEALGTLEEVAVQLRSLVDAVTLDLEVARGFPASAQALGDAVVALGTVTGDTEGTQRLARALESLPGDK